MTQDLKTKIGTAIAEEFEALAFLGSVGARKGPILANIAVGAINCNDIANAALQAIHDAGFLLIPDVRTQPFSQNTAYAERVGPHVLWKTFDGATIDPIWAVLLAISKAEAQPKTEEG